MSNRKHRREIDKAVRNLIDFAERQDVWRERLDDALSQFLGPLADSLQVDEQVLVAEFEDSGFWPMVFGYVFEEFAAALWDNEPRSLIEEYLQRRGWREAAYARRYLQAINDAEVRFWEIVSVKPGISVDVRPHGNEGKAFRVMEKSASESLHQWDCLAARIVKMDGKPMFTGALLSFPPSEAERVQRVMAKVRDDLIKLFHDLVKEGEVPELPEDLEQLAEDEMEANLPDVLFQVWGAFVYNAVQNVMPQLQNMDDQIPDAEPPGDGLDMNSTPEGQAVIKEYMDKHYRQTLDEPIPMLNDKTPRECAADPSLHEHVVQWLKYLENQAAGVPSQSYDFSWIWRELDLEKYR